MAETPAMRAAKARRSFIFFAFWGWGGVALLMCLDGNKCADVPMRFGDELGPDPFQRTNACASAQQVV